MKSIFFIIFLVLIQSIGYAQLPPWNLEFYVFHPDGNTDTLWVGCDENATDGFDEGLDIIDTSFNTPIAIRSFSQEVEDTFNYGTCVNLKKDIRPFGYPTKYIFYILHDEIGTSDSIYLGWDTSMLNYEVGDFWIEGAILFSSYGYIEGIDGIEKFLCSRGSFDSVLDYGFQPIPIFSLGETLPCFNNSGYSKYYLKIVLEVYFKDYGVFLYDNVLNSNSLTIYPNPITTDEFTIFTKNSEEATVEIFDMHSKLIFSTKVSGSDKYILSFEFQQGIYTLKFSQANRFQNAKIIKL